MSLTEPAARPRSSRRGSPASRPLPPVSAHVRRRVIGWLLVCCLALVALPLILTVSLFSRANQARARVMQMEQGTALECETLESALLDDWNTVADAVQAAYEDTGNSPQLRRRCGEMLRMHSTNDALAIREGRCREIRLAFSFGDFLSQERAQDRFLATWNDYEPAAHDLARDRELPDCVRLRCVEMIQVTSTKPAAVALANFSRATRCYRAWGRANDPRAAKDEEAAWVHDDPNTYQSPDAGFPLGRPASEATDRARDLFGLASDQYYDIAEETSGNEKLSAQERGQRAIRLRLAAIKYGKDDSIYEDYMRERKKDIEENKKKKAPPPPPAP